MLCYGWLKHLLDALPFRHQGCLSVVCLLTQNSLVTHLTVVVHTYLGPRLALASKHVHRND